MPKRCSVYFVMLFSLLSILMFLLTFNCIGSSYSDRFPRTINQNDRRQKLDGLRIKRKEAFIVTPPFEMNIAMDKMVTSDLSNNVLRGDSDVKFTNNNYEKNYYADETDLSMETRYRTYTDNENKYPVSSVEALMRIITKQNVLIKKLITLYQAEVKHREFKEVLELINKRNEKMALRQNKHGSSPIMENTDPPVTDNVSDATTVPIDTTQDTTTSKTAADESKNGLSIITVDEVAVRSKLARDPFIKRVLAMARRKKDEYMKRRRQEMELERKGK